MRDFVNYLRDKLVDLCLHFEVLDCDDHHAMIEAQSSGDWFESHSLSETIIIPFMTRFLLVTNRNELEGKICLQVQCLRSKYFYLICTRQEKRGDHFFLQISIKEVIP